MKQDREGVHAYAREQGWTTETAQMTWQAITTFIDRWTKPDSATVVTAVWVHSPELYEVPYWAKGHWEREERRGRIEAMVSGPSMAAVSLQRALDDDFPTG